MILVDLIWFGAALDLEYLNLNLLGNPDDMAFSAHCLSLVDVSSS